MAETYGLEPNYGCCTANFNQGWPKFAHSLVFTRKSDTGEDGSDGVVVAQYAPATVVLPNGGGVDVEGDFPFEDTVTVTVTTAKATTAAVDVWLRIPAWAVGATVNGEAAANGTMHATTAAGGGASTGFVVDFKPAVRLETWDHVRKRGEEGGGEGGGRERERQRERDRESE
jgi:hypothetical protein